MAKIVYSLAVPSNGGARKFPVPVPGGGGGWQRVSVNFATEGVDVRRAVVGPRERPIVALSPSGVESARYFVGNGYVDLQPGDQYIVIELDAIQGGWLDLFVEASD